MRARWRGLSRDLLERLRYQSHSGQLIRQHRALHRLEFRSASILHPTVLLGASYLLLWAGADLLGRFWFAVCRFWLLRLDLPGTLFLSAGQAFGPWRTPVPGLAVTVTVPSMSVLGILACVAALGMGAAYLLCRRQWLPLAYAIWAMGTVQIFACICLWLAPSRYTHTLSDHFSGGFDSVVVLLYLTPLLLSFSYYAFDHRLLRKALGTAVILGGLVLVAPYQYLAHVALVDTLSLAVLPLLFTAFGLLFDIAVFVALYAWVVSWEP